MPKPTPSQARLLRQLSAGPLIHCLQWGDKARLCDEEGRPDHEAAPLNLRTLMACRRLGWIHLTHSRTQYDWSGRLYTLYCVSDTGRVVLADLPASAFVSKSQARPVATPKGEAARVMAALADRHPRPEWIFITEPTVPVLEERPADEWGPARTATVAHRMDALALSSYHSSGYKRVGYEIKVSRSDFLRERAHPEKTARSACNCSEFYFACPKGVVQPDDLPDPYGLVTVSPSGRSRIIKRSHVVDRPPTWALLAYLLRRVTSEEMEVSND